MAIITGTELSPKRELLCKVWGLYLEKNIPFMLTALPFYPRCFGDRLYRVNPHTVRTQTSPPILSPALAFSIHWLERSKTCGWHICTYYSPSDRLLQVARVSFLQDNESPFPYSWCVAWPSRWRDSTFSSPRTGRSSLHLGMLGVSAVKLNLTDMWEGGPIYSRALPGQILPLQEELL